MKIKTEHSGAKRGKGAFYGRKADAKRHSNKARRSAGKRAIKGD
jgi:hypothetical protein